jgi:hypothetical protein
MNPFAFFLAIADKVHTALNLLDPTRTYAAADSLWARQRGAEGLAEKEAEEEAGEPDLVNELTRLTEELGLYDDAWLRDLLERADSAAATDIDRAFTVENREFFTGYRAAIRWVLLLLRQQSSAAPASQTDAPGEASGVPEGVSTPDPDAPSGHLNEFPWCLALTPNKLFMCRRAVGHTGLHRDTTEWSDPEK